MISHDEDPVQILRYIQGDLKDEELAEFSRHLGVCSQCRTRVDEEKALSGLFQKTAPLYTAPAELHGRVAASLATELHSRSSLPRKIWARAIWKRGEVQESRHWGAQRLLPAFGTMLIAILCVLLLRGLRQEFRAREYVQAAIAAHLDTLDGRHPIEIQSDVPETVTRWAGERVAFHFRLPLPQNVPEGGSRFELAGARLVELRQGRGVMVVYHGQNQAVSLLIAPENAAVVSGGDEVQDGRLLFHYRHRDGFNVITWKNHGLAYALVSSVSGPARQSCLVCHGSLPAH
jgi:anti-sigma factor RsiW